jgi:hypothetical protein
MAIHPPLHFRGGPTRLLATVHSGTEMPFAKAGRVTLTDKDSMPLTVRRVASTTPSVSLLSFRLPKSTRPGSYEGKVELGDAQIPIRIEVEARPRLHFIPAKLSLRGGPGAVIQAKIFVLNLGNVEAVVKPKDTFCIFDNRGVDRAFFSALTVNETTGKHRLDLLMDELSESHGGLVRTTVQAGHGELAPEESRELVVQFQFSRRMRAGHTYRGMWFVSEANLEVEIEALDVVEEGAE